MKLKVRYFASIREALGPVDEVDAPTGATLAQLRDLLITRSPKHAAALDRQRPLRCALNQTLTTESAVIPEGAEVAFFPPVTGG